MEEVSHLQTPTHLALTFSSQFPGKELPREKGFGQSCTVARTQAPDAPC